VSSWGLSFLDDGKEQFIFDVMRECWEGNYKQNLSFYWKTHDCGSSPGFHAIDWKMYEDFDYCSTSPNNSTI
jgi:hypothetical protein